MGKRGETTRRRKKVKDDESLIALGLGVPCCSKNALTAGLGQAAEQAVDIAVIEMRDRQPRPHVAKFRVNAPVSATFWVGCR